MPRAPSAKATVRCAVYTRKSSEEGLEQNFNSLDAQREACEAFILSQKHEGWTSVAEIYDDGGISGATMERPALKRLLSDVEARKIDAVVVYKVDRLTRSLSDFVKMVEIFNCAGASFVSVTQQFNTTSSMGRLTLNMLLSFAQFEREVTGERIRDKIAASKKKGMWMGGLPSMGYDAVDRKLVVNETEAETVRHIYRRYLELGSVRLLKDELDGNGVVSKVRTDRYGRKTGGNPLDRGGLYRTLQNRVYRGEIVHKQESYPGEHEAIIDDRLWHKVQELLAANRVGHKTGAGVKEPSLLAGLLYDEAGERMTPVRASKKGKRYRYYVSRSLVTGVRKQSPKGLRVPAGDVEELVMHRLTTFLTDKAELHAAVATDVMDGSEREHLIARACELADRLRTQATAEKRRILLLLIASVGVGRERLQIRVRRERLPQVLRCSDSPQSYDWCGDEDETVLTLTVAARLMRVGMETKLLIEGPGAGPRGKPNANLIRLIVQAHRFNKSFTRGRGPISELAKEAGVSRSYFTRVLRLSFLAPETTRAILLGRQPAELTANKLMGDTRLPILWEDQSVRLGFS